MKVYFIRTDPAVSTLYGRGSFDFFVPRAERREKLRAPLVGGLEDHALPDAPDEDLLLIVRKAKFLRKPHGLASSVGEDLRSCHLVSIYAYLYNAYSDRNRRTCGERHAVTATTSRVMQPPKITDGTTPSSRAATPDSNAPISFDAPMKI